MSSGRVWTTFEINNQLTSAAASPLKTMSNYPCEDSTGLSMRTAQTWLRTRARR